MLTKRSNPISNPSKITLFNSYIISVILIKISITINKIPVSALSCTHISTKFYTLISGTLTQWKEVEYNLEQNTFMSKNILKAHLNRFWNDIMVQLPEDQHVRFIMKLKFIDNQIITSFSKVNLCKLIN